MINVTDGYDIISANWNYRPKAGQSAVYTTGTPDIQATAAMLREAPRAVRIDQAATAAQTDFTADAFDCESGAITERGIGGIVRGALGKYDERARTGQRIPVVYASAIFMGDVTAVLDKAGLRGSGVGLWVAHWGISRESAVLLVGSEIGGYPVRAVQWKNAGYYDADVFDTAWLREYHADVPPGQWNANGQWNWRQCVITGTDVNGNLRSWAFNPATGGWDVTLA